MRERHGFSASEMYGLVWLMFLLVPLVLIWSLDPAELYWRIIATIATVIFGAICAWTTLFERWPLRRNGLLTLPQVALVLAVLAVPIVISVPALGVGITSFAPYIAAVGVFGLPLRRGLYWAAITALITTFVPWFISPELVFTAAIGPALGVLFIVVMRVLDERSAAEMRAQNELAWVQEREAISRDVHDMLGHTLTIVSLKTQLALRTVRSDPDRCEAELTELMRLNQRALEEVRATVGRLRTPDLAAQVDDAESAMRAADVEVTRLGNWARWSPDRRALAAWAIRETSTNIIRHAGATECRIEFSEQGFSITDNGKGVANLREGHGLTGLRRRAEDGGGTLSIRDTGTGTEVRLEFV